MDFGLDLRVTPPVPPDFFDANRANAGAISDRLCSPRDSTDAIWLCGLCDERPASTTTPAAAAAPSRRQCAFLLWLLRSRHNTLISKKKTARSG